MNTEKTISNIVEELQKEAMPFEQYVYEPKKTHQIIRKHLNKQRTFYGVVKLFISHKMVRGFGLGLIVAMGLTLLSKHLFYIPEFLIGWFSCTGYWLVHVLIKK